MVDAMLRLFSVNEARKVYILTCLHLEFDCYNFYNEYLFMTPHACLQYTKVHVINNHFIQRAISDNTTFLWLPDVSHDQKCINCFTLWLHSRTLMIYS